MQKQKVVVIGGPTASGKTNLSIKLAQKINGEIVSADSMQIYKEMNIGTAKPDEEEKQGIQHYMMDIINPDERYSVADYKRQAKTAIREIINKGKVPIVVGGTGLYIDSLIYEIEYVELETDLEYRKQLEERVEKEGLQELYKEAKSIDECAMEKISPNDRKRILRVLEIYKQTGKTKTELDKQSRKNVEYDYKVFAINMDREILYDRINKRVDLMFEQGLVDEAQNILKSNYSKTSMNAIGYKEFIPFFNHEISLLEVKENIKRQTRRYAKRQLTWFKRNKDINWIYVDEQSEFSKILDISLNHIMNSGILK